MNSKRKLWVAAWVMLVVITGIPAFGCGSVGMGYGPWHDRNHMGEWDDYGAGGYSMHHGMRYGRSGDAYAMMPWRLSDLSAEQEQKIGQLRKDADDRNRSLTQQSVALHASLNTLYASEKRDWNAIRETSLSLSDLQRQQMEIFIGMQQKMDELLTDSQRQELLRAGRGYGNE